MLARHYLMRNPYFLFDPLHMLFSLLASMILFGLMMWILAIPAL
jgi:hypothetical protein